MFNKFLRAEMDKLQDRTDKEAGKHIEIPLTISLFAELSHRAEIEMQKPRNEG